MEKITMPRSLLAPALVGLFFATLCTVSGHHWSFKFFVEQAVQFGLAFLGFFWILCGLGLIMVTPGSNLPGHGTKYLILGIVVWMILAYISH